ncbi:MAG: hypothetical protein CVU56_06605 [Deltaproteobacteria bacterium HGW-Deltaproteobacteria-14]|nr:MAG: hypothetical protein CVU56_06605 [Deltaproteobacteria bacterium HGW-Deltaproteobacteria-14]
MAAALDELRSEVAQNPSDAEALRRFGVACLASGEVTALHDWIAGLLRDADDPEALRSPARALGEALSELAAGADDDAEALELYLRAARLLGEHGDAPDAAAEALARAWRIRPDERVGDQAHTLLGRPAIAVAPEYLLIALSQVGSEATRVQSLRRLAAIELEARHIDQARALYQELRDLRPDDPDATAGLDAIETLRTSAEADAREAREQVPGKTVGEDAVVAWTRLGDAEKKRGDVPAAEAAYLEAMGAGSAPQAEAALEALMREGGRLDDLADFWTGLLEGASRARQVLLRRRLFRLLHDELGRPDDARRFLVLTASVPAADADDVIARARAAGADGDWAVAIQILEDGAASAASRDARIAILLEAARVHEIEQQDLVAAERAYRRVRVTDPRDLAALAFYRRWYAEHGEPRRAWANLVQLHAVLDGPELAGERVDVGIEMAAVAEQGLASWDKAIEAWRRVLADAPGHPQALSELGRIYEAAGRWHALVDHLEGWARSLPDEAVEQKIELLFKVIDCYQDPTRLPMREMVVQTYERIVALSPTNVVALDGLAGSLTEREQWRELVAVLAKKIDVTDDPEELLGLFEQIASLWLDRIRSETQAIPVLERILELAPDNLDVIDRLKEIYRRRHDSERLYTTYERELALLSGTDRIDVLSELAALATDPLFRPQDAIRWWRQVLSIDGRHEGARAALEALHAEQSDWDGYVALLEQRAGEARTRKQKVEVLLELGEIVYSRLEDPDRAQAIFTEIAELSPFNTTARQFLQRLYVARRGWDALQALYAPREDWRGYTSLLTDYADRAGDRFLAADIHVELARAFEAHLDDASAALRHLELALKATPERADVARDLLGRYDAHVKGERRMAPLETLGEHGEDPAERLAAWRELAELHQAAGDPRTLSAWSHALVAEAPLGSVTTADALIAAADAASAWEDAYTAMQEALGRLPVEAAGARLRLHRGLGTLASVRLGRQADAVQHLRWVLQLAPGDAAALDALEKIYFSQNDFEGLEDVFKARADAAATADERVAPLLRLGQLYEDILVDMPRAASVYQEILVLAPADEEAQEAVARVLDQEEAYTDLAAIFETALTRLDDAGKRRTVDLRLATLYATKLDQPLAAVDHYQAVLEDGGDLDEATVSALEGLFEDPRARVAAAPLLEEIYRRREDPAKLVEALAARLETADLATERLALLDEIAMLSEGALGDADSAFEAMLERFRAAPADKDTWRELERLAEVTDSWEELAAGWRAQVETGAGLPPDRLVALRMALAEIYHRRLIEVDDAVAQVEQARSEATDPADVLAALESLEVLYKKVADLDKFVEVKLAASERVISRDARRRKILHACQALSGPLKRVDEAVALCNGLLDEDPADADAGDALAGMLARAERYDALEALLGRRLVAVTDREQQDALHFQRALLRRDQLGRWEDAISELIGLIDAPRLGWEARQALLEISRAQESESQRELILEALEEHYAGTGDAEGRLAVLLVQADFAAAGGERAALLRAAGQVCMPDPARAADGREDGVNAFGLYTQALYEEPEDPTALAALVALAEAMGHWEPLVDSLEECGQQPPPRAGLMPLWRTVAALSEERLGDVPRAIRAWQRQLDVRAADPSADAAPALDALDRLFAAEGDREARLDVLERKREAASDDDVVIALLIEQARLHEALERPDAATSTLQEALAVARAGGSARAAAQSGLVTRLETLLTTAGRHGDVVELLLVHAADRQDPDEARLLRYRAAEVAAERLADGRRAAAIYHEILAEQPRDEVALEELNRIYAELEDWGSQAEVMETRLAMALEADATAEATGLRLELGALYDERLDAPHEAAPRYAAILDEDPANAAALQRLASMVAADRAASLARSVLADAHRRAGDPAALATVLEATLAAGDAGGAPAGLHAELSQIYRSLLDAPQQAWTHAAAAYGFEPLGDAGDAQRLAVLELADDGGDRAALSTLLLEVAARVSDPVARLARRLDDIASLRERDADGALLLPHWIGVLADAPSHAEALAEIEAWARANDDDALLMRALTGRIASSRPEARVPLQLELGRLMMKEGRAPDEVAEVYRAVLAVDPLERDAFLALVRIETRRKGWSALAALYEARLELQAETEEAPGLMKRLARLRSQHLGDPAGAVALYSEVLATVPEADPEALAGLEGLWGEGLERRAIFRVLEPRYEEQGNWDKLIALYTSTLESEQDTDLQEECLLKMAQLEAVKLDRPEAAYATLRALVDRKDDPGEQLDQLEELAERAQKWDDLAAFYESRVASGRADAALMARLAWIQETRTGDLERAIHFYRFALEREPRDRPVRERLSALLERTARWEDLVALYVVSADATEDDEDRVALWFAAARLLDDELDRPTEAVELLEQVVDVRPAEPDAHEVIVALLERVGEREALHEHLRRWIELVATDEQAVELQVRLGRSLVAFPETVREGLTELEDVFGTRPGHAGVVMALEEMLERAEDLDAAGEEVPATMQVATAEAASMLEGVVGADATAEEMARIVMAQLRPMAKGEERQATLARLGGLLVATGDWKQAFDSYAEALAEDLGNAEIEAALEAIAEAHGNWEALGALYESCVGAESRSESVTTRYLLKLADILRVRLDRADDAVAWYERLLTELPTSRDALGPLAAYYQASSDAVEEARILAQWAEQAAHDEELGGLLRRLAVLRMDQLGDAAGAIDALERTLPESAADADVVARLERLYVKTGAFDRLGGLYDSALAADHDPARTVELLAKLAQVCETRLNDQERARDACRRILHIDAQHGFALTTLERVERALEDWDAVDEVLGWRIDAATAKDRRAMLLVDRAEVAVSHRSMPEAALAFVNEADDLTGPGAGPDHLIAGYELLLRSDDVRLEASRRLQRRYKARKAWPRLVNALMIEQRATSVPAERVVLTERAADVAERKIGDPKMALRLAVTALRADPDVTRLRELAVELAERTAEWGPLVEAAAGALEAAQEADLVVDLGLWLGPLQWERAQDAAGAIRTYEAVLGARPGCVPAVTELMRLYDVVGDWRGLKDLLTGRLLEVEAEGREAVLLRLASVVAEHESPAEAVPILREVLHARPDSAAAVELLHGMLGQKAAGEAAAEVLDPVYRQSAAWQRLVELYEVRAATQEQPEERAALLRNAATVYEEYLGDRIEAFKMWARSVHEAPDESAGLRQMERLGAAIGAWDQLARVLSEVRPRMSERAAQRDALLHMAQIHEVHLGAPEKAIVNLLAVLELEPRHRGAMVGLHRLYAKRGDLQALADMTRTLAAVETSTEAKRRLWDELYAASRAAEEPDGMMNACLAMLDLDEGDREAAERLLPLYEAEGLYPEMMQVIARLAGHTTDAAEEARLKLTLARLREQRLDDRAGAIEAYEEAWELDGSAEAAERLESYYAADARWANLASLLRARIDRARNPEEQVALQLRLAKLQAEELRNADEATQTYVEVLDEAPGEMAAYDALVSLYAKQRRYAELARVLERKAEVLGGSPDGLTARVQAAAVLLDQLDDARRASELLRSVLVDAPDHAEGMLLMARLHVKEGEAAKAATLLEALVGKVDGMRRFRILLELARIHGEQLGNAARALPFALEARVIAPDNTALHRLLRDLLERTGKWADLLELLDTDYAGAKNATEQRRRALALARLHHERTGDEEAFTLWIDRAEAADGAEDSEVAELAVAHYTGREVWREVAPRLERLVEHMVARHETARLAPRAFELGGLFERLGEDAKAAAAYRRALEADGTYVPNLVAFGRLLLRLGEWTEALRVHQSLLMQSAKLADDESRDEVLYNLALASAELGQKTRAKQFLQKLDKQAPAHAGAAALRARLG